MARQLRKVAVVIQWIKILILYDLLGDILSVQEIS